MVYVTFIADPLPLPEGARVNEYQVKAVVGNGPIEPGGKMRRIETEVPLDAGLRGVVQHLHYTTVEERTDLVARSRTELAPSPNTTAVLIPIRKSAEWWAMAHDQRAAHFHGQHTPIGAPYVETIFRKLYHSRYYEDSPYDFLTYFEFPDDKADVFRALLAELRDTGKNPEWAYVETEFEVWMTKLK
jgi:chlorite dismutase